MTVGGTRGRGLQRSIPIAIVVAVGIAIVALIVFSLAYTPVEFGTVGLVKRFGGLTGNVYAPGLHWRVPFIDSIVTVPTAVRSYETSDNPSASNANFTDIPVKGPHQVLESFHRAVEGPIRPPVMAVGPLLRMTDQEAIIGPPEVVKSLHQKIERPFVLQKTVSIRYHFNGVFDLYAGKVAKEGQQLFPAFGIGYGREPLENRTGTIF